MSKYTPPRWRWSHADEAEYVADVIAGNPRCSRCRGPMTTRNVCRWCGLPYRSREWDEFT